MPNSSSSSIEPGASTPRAGLRSYLTLYPKLAFGLVVLLVLIVFNLTREPLESRAQRSYSQWLALQSEALREWGPTTLQPLPEIQITVQRAGRVINFNFPNPATSTLPADQQAARALRLMEQIREAQLFAQGQAVSLEQREQVKSALREQSLLEVRSGKDEFLLLLPTTLLETDTRAQLLLKLLDLYASAEALPVVAPPVGAEPAPKQQKRKKNKQEQGNK
jgi:hypothetical protein